jgi:hypothetical protein
LIKFKWHKFKAKPLKEDGIHFPSKLQYSYFKQLQLEKTSGHVLFFLRDVPFHLPGGTVYRLDFMVFYASGEIRFIDVKGVETPVFKIKKREVEAIYPVEIEVIKRRKDGRFGKDT